MARTMYRLGRVMRMSYASFLLAILVLTATYLFGAYSARHQLFPFPLFQALKTRVGSTAPDDLYTFDQAGRLASGDQKKAVACPQQTDRTAVLLLIGQSNDGNHGGNDSNRNTERRLSISSMGNAISPRHPCWDLTASAVNIGPSSAISCWIADRSTRSCWLPRP